MKDPNIPAGMIEQIYECAAEADTGPWQDVYEQLSMTLSAGTGSIQYIVKAENRIVPIATTNPPGYEEALGAYLPSIPYGDAVKSLRTGELFERYRHLGDAEFKRTAVYKSFFKGLDKFHMLHHCLASTPEFVAGISFTRPENMARFSEAEIAKYMRVGQHIQRALRLQIELSGLAGERRVLSAGWDRMKRAAFFVNEMNQVVFYNAAAGEMVKRGGGVKLARGGEIGFARQRETRRLRDMVARAMVMAEGGVMAAPQPGKEEPLYVSVSPFAEKFGPPGLSRRVALVIINEPLKARDGAGIDLVKLFGLTAAESRVACMIADGDSIKEISDKLSVSEQTARTHLKRIFGKTGTKRQAALVKLVLSLPNHHHKN